MPTPTGIHLVIPSTLAVGEPFVAKVRVLGAVRPVECRGAYCTRKPGLGGPFNLNVERRIQFVDDCLPAWEGALQIDEAPGMTAPAKTLVFDGRDQGTFPGDTRPIKPFEGFTFTTPGFHFLSLTDPASGVAVRSNPCYVNEAAPARRLVWGDPHWQSFFSDGVRCPEELYHFARYEGFLDFGAISDHMEALTPRQWDYFMAVTNDYNAPGRFATLIGQEWTHHDPRHGAPGHRNIYVRGDRAPLLSSTDPDCNTLAKLWAALDAIDAPVLAIPHHSANVVMGVDWSAGWNPKYEKAVEMISVWGSSEKPARDGNTRPIQAGKGEMDGRHVLDALRLGYRFGFVGGGDVHDGRPGLALHDESYPPRDHTPYPQGLTAAWIPRLTREDVFDAIVENQTYATTNSRIYLDVDDADGVLSIRTASEDGLRRIVVVSGAGEMDLKAPAPGARVAEVAVDVPALKDDDFRYVRVETTGGELAWSSPRYGGEA
ncbi:MAG: DUF3604 domain-containing protein [Planctomycetota bacterium]